MKALGKFFRAEGAMEYLLIVGGLTVAIAGCLPSVRKRSLGTLLRVSGGFMFGWGIGRLFL